MNVHELGRALSRLIGPLERRVRLSIGRAIIRLVDDSLKAQAVQLDLLAGETIDNVERFQEYGFTSKPFAGAEAVAVFVGGNRSHGIVIACEDRRYRLKGLDDGEVAIYDDQGQVVRLKRDSVLVSSPAKIECQAPQIQHDCDVFTVNAATKARFVTPRLEATADVIDTCDANTRTMGGMRTIYNSHTHTDPQGGSVSVTSQVM